MPLLDPQNRPEGLDHPLVPKILRIVSKWNVAAYRATNGFLGGTSRVTVTVKGPDGMPSSETHVVSESTGGLFAKDRANVARFCEKFWMRVT